MEQRITATDLARRLGDVLGRVRDRGDSFLVEQNGQAVARLLPVVGRAAHDRLRRAPRRGAARGHGGPGRREAGTCRRPRRSGRTIPSNDLTVAATAVELGFAVAVGSADEAHFRQVPDLDVLSAFSR